MKKTGAWLAVHALEQIGIKWTFGIPGVHTTELYDELNNSQSIRPVLVTHEGCASFMADAVSRTAKDTIGVLAIVPAAGLTHAASGIGEARLAGIPMLVITGGIRTDLNKRFQLHEIDQMSLAKELTKAAFRILRHEDIIPTIFEAFRIATDGEPGPVLIELPVNLQLLPGKVAELPRWQPLPPPPGPDGDQIREAIDLLLTARKPTLYVGWGARQACAEIIALAELLQAPVATTLQGLASFPANHPLHAGFGFGASAVPAARNAFKGCDCMIAIGARFAEIATGSFGVNVPRDLIHIDINPSVFDANYPARIKLAGDAKTVLAAMCRELETRGEVRAANTALTNAITRDKQKYQDEWHAHNSRGRVNPARFFAELRRQVPDQVIAAVDDGNHTYLTAELFPIHAGGQLIVPTDFNAMGYAIPAAIGAHLANTQPDNEVFAIVGDGAFMMTCMELVTAVTHSLGIVVYVFHDGELAQISQAQALPYNRKPCTTLGRVNLEGVALATGAAYLSLSDDTEAASTITAARKLAADGIPVIVDVAIDYSKRTAFTNGLLRTNLKRFPLGQRIRLITRAVKRRITS